MRIEFADERLARICTNEAHKLGLPVAIIKGARNKLVLLESAKDERDLRNWKSLHYEKYGTQRSIRVNDQYRIVFDLDDQTVPPTIRITYIGDYH